MKTDRKIRLSNAYTLAENAIFTMKYLCWLFEEKAQYLTIKQLEYIAEHFILGTGGDKIREILNDKIRDQELNRFIAMKGGGF